MTSHNLADFISKHEIPEALEFTGSPPPLRRSTPVRVRGTLQAGNEHAIYILVGTILLKIPGSVITGIHDLPEEPARSVEVFISPEAHLEARTELALRPEDDELPLALNEHGLHLGERSTQRLARDRELTAKLLRFIDLAAVQASDGGTSTYSYLSSATTKPDGGSDSDPIREQDD